MEQLENRVAVVTGAGSGIGRALAHTLAARGCRLVLADIEEQALRGVENELNAANTETLAVLTDVTDEASVGALAARTLERFGAVHILCNNAGVGGGGYIKNLQLVDWKWVIDVCLWGVIHGIHHFLPHLRAAPEAHIMSTASVAGLISNPGLGPYNAAKYGVVAIMETLYHEMQSDSESNVGVSVLCPGEVNTNITSAQRNRPEHLKAKKTGKPINREEAQRRNAAIAAALREGMDPMAVAGLVADAIEENRFWVLSHPEYLDDIRHRNEGLHSLSEPTLLRKWFDA